MERPLRVGDYITTGSVPKKRGISKSELLWFVPSRLEDGRSALLCHEQQCNSRVRDFNNIQMQQMCLKQHRCLTSGASPCWSFPLFTPLQCFHEFFLLILTPIIFVHVYISKLLFILLLIHNYIRNIITSLYSQRALNTVSRLRATFSSFKQARGKGGTEMRESHFWVSSSIYTASLIVPELRQPRDLYQSITYWRGHLDFLSISPTDLQGKYHSVLGEVYQSRPTQENANILGVSRRNLIQKFDYTGDGRTKTANRRYWGNSEISHSR